MTRRAWCLFALSSAIWGVPYLFIRVAVDAGVPPAFIAWARVALAAALLLPFALRRGALRGLRGRSGAIAAYAACEIAVPFVLIAMGERYISSSLTASRPIPATALRPAVWARPPQAIPASALWAIAVLGVVCTALGLVVFFQLIAEAGRSRASVITYINPLVAVLLGVVVLDEHLGPMSVAGLVLILAGSWLSTGGRVPVITETGK